MAKKRRAKEAEKDQAWNWHRKVGPIDEAGRSAIKDRLYTAGELLLIPYEYEGVQHHYEPDYVVRLMNGATLILEVKGEKGDDDCAKHQAARRWVDAVNNWGRLGHWDFLECLDPQLVPPRLRERVTTT